MTTATLTLKTTDRGHAYKIEAPGLKTFHQGHLSEVVELFSQISNHTEVHVSLKGHPIVTIRNGKITPAF